MKKVHQDVMDRECKWVKTSFKGQVGHLYQHVICTCSLTQHFHVENLVQGDSGPNARRHGQKQVHVV